MTALADDKKTEYREGVDISIPVDDADLEGFRIPMLRILEIRGTGRQ